MTIKNVLLIGGSGFVGHHLANKLAARGCSVIIPTRRRDRVKDLLPLPTVEVVEADVFDTAALAGLAAGCDAVVNLVGILASRNGSPYGPDFARAHVELPRSIVHTCRAAGITRLLHVSALQAHPNAPSQYLRSKADGEAAIREGGDAIATTIFRPSVIFGGGDKFLNLFAGLAALLPVMALASPQARFQPVYVEDVANAMVESLERPEAAGASYELCGPTVYTLRQLVEYACTTAGRPRLVVGLPDALGSLLAGLLEMLPGKLMTRDNLASMRVDSICDGCALPFGLNPTALAAVAPTYLAGATPRAHFMAVRTRAGR